MATPITADDIQARVPPEDFVKLFDRDGDGTVDDAFLQTCINTAHSDVLMRVYAAFGADFDMAGGTVDEAIKAMEVAYACHHALLFNPIYSDKDGAPFKAAVKRADEFFDALKRDTRRVVTSAVGPAKPRPSVNRTTDIPPNPLSLAADRKDSTGF